MNLDTLEGEPPLFAHEEDEAAAAAAWAAPPPVLVTGPSLRGQPPLQPKALRFPLSRPRLRALFRLLRLLFTRHPEFFIVSLRFRPNGRYHPLAATPKQLLVVAAGGTACRLLRAAGERAGAELLGSLLLPEIPLGCGKRDREGERERRRETENRKTGQRVDRAIARSLSGLRRVSAAAYLWR